MDGNNRWAKQRGLAGNKGHREGVERIRDVMSACKRQGVEVLTLFAFSSENWERPPKEVEALMGLFQLYLKNEAKKLKKEGVKLRVIGSRERFSEKLCKAIDAAESIACDGQTTLVIAADYGGQWDMANAARKIALQVAAGELSPEQVGIEQVAKHMSVQDLPPVDMLIRTGGEMRISNFLLWQAAYSELVFSDTLWPDFGEAALDAAVLEFQGRQRRFGKTSEQVALGE
jgi:undecaprenyl diphosphate synthase